MLTRVQPAPEAAIELIHKQPVRWIHDRYVECDGGGGPLGHPKIFINLDKPQICTCGYCGLPFVRSIVARDYHGEEMLTAAIGKRAPPHIPRVSSVDSISFGGSRRCCRGELEPACYGGSTEWL